MRRAFLLCFIISVAGCATTAAPTASPSGALSETPPPAPTADPEATASPGVVQASTGPTATPTTPPLANDLASGAFARVVVNGLAVRTGPSVSYPLISAYRWDNTRNAEVHATDAVRVDDGHFLHVVGGPFVVLGETWYRVGNVGQPDDAVDEHLRWDSDGDGMHFDSGWVAGGSAEAPFLVPAEQPPPPSGAPVFGPGPAPYAAAWGMGDGRTDSFEATSPISVRWTAADPEGTECDMRVTLQPAGIDMGSAHVNGWGEGDEWWPRDSSSMDGDYWVEIRSDCSWSLQALLIQG